ncbi:MAG: cytochrome c [Anaerolineae bacterium]|nr:cytochrome c [Anaerolineae bacterium]
MKLRHMTLLKSFLYVLPVVLILGACSGADQPPAPPMTLPPGDAAHGAELFAQSVNGAPACNTCHLTDENTLVGPGLKGFAARADERISGENAEQYTQESITQPASVVVSGFPNAMYNQYASKLSPQDIADLVAYLMTL